MIAFAPLAGGLHSSDQVQMFVAGAEANVAIGLAHLGVPVEWFGRVGNDPFGIRIQSTLQAHEVDTGRVVVDPVLPTGLYFKDRLGSSSTMYYYRAGAAATALSPADADRLALEARQLVHISGITPALSPSCAAFAGRIVDEVGRSAVSFDVNFRDKLWPVAEAAPRILALARKSRIVLAGRDEAETLWGTPTAADIRELFPDADIVVVKDSHIGATEFRGDTQCFVPAPKVEVVEPIGAGDAFAAGYLSAFLNGDSGEACLRLGHVMAAHALGQSSDSPDLPELAALRDLAARSGEDWARVVFAGHAASAPQAR